MSQDFIFLNQENLYNFFKVLEDALKETNYTSIIDRDSFKNQLEYLLINKKTSFLLAETQNNIGFLLSSINNYNGYIALMAVKNEFRNKGYGQVLLQKSMLLLQENNCNNILLEVDDKNESAIRLYEKSGFLITRKILHFRIENYTFYRYIKDNDLGIKKGLISHYKILYKQYQKEKQPWQKQFACNIIKLRKNISKLLLFEIKSINIGYVLYSKKNNILYIDDIGINKKYYDKFPVMMSLFIKNSSQEKIIQANNFYDSNPLCDFFHKTGFYIDAKQYEMSKRIL